MHSIKKIFIVIFLGFLLSTILSTYYISKYDKYNEDGKGHIMLKDDTLHHWKSAAKIVEEVKSGNNFFLSGGPVNSKPLLQRIVALYSIISGHEIIEEQEPNLKLKLGGKLPFLVFQSLIYYLSLFYLTMKIVKFFPTKNCFYIILFLSLEPTIFQFHSSFWTESIYLTLQILILSLALNNSRKFFICFIIGILCGLLLLQRTVGVFYLVPVIIFYIFQYNKKSIRPIISIIFGYSLIAILLIGYNYKKTNSIYFLPSEVKNNIFAFFFIDVLAKAKNTPVTVIRKNEIIKTNDWLIKNNINLVSSPDIDNFVSVTSFFIFIDGKEDVILNDYLFGRAMQIFYENPVVTLKHLTFKLSHFNVLNPMFIYFNYEHRGKNKEPQFYLSDTHKKIIPIRIFYSILIYLICAMGFFHMYKEKNYKILLLVTLSIFYYQSVAGWYGQTRLQIPILIYLSFLFGNGIIFTTNFLNKKK